MCSIHTYCTFFLHFLLATASDGQRWLRGPEGASTENVRHQPRLSTTHARTTRRWMIDGWQDSQGDRTYVRHQSRLTTSLDDTQCHAHVAQHDDNDNQWQIISLVWGMWCGGVRVSASPSLVLSCPVPSASQTVGVPFPCECRSDWAEPWRLPRV